MIITDKFVFIHDPKQGGSFVTRALFELYGARWNIFKHLQMMVFKEITAKSKYGNLTMLSLKHAGCGHIPTEFRDRKILTTVRNPYDWCVSQYEFGWWKNKSLFKFFNQAQIAAKELHFEMHLIYTPSQSVSLSSATKDELAKAAQTLGLPLMLKSRREAYETPQSTFEK